MRNRFRAKHWLVLAVGTVAILAFAVWVGTIVPVLWFWIVEPLLVFVLWAMLLSAVNEAAYYDGVRSRLDRYLRR